MRERPLRGILRVLDANINRAREGLRVCEDLVRLAFGSQRYFRQMRALRYALNDAVRALPVEAADLAEARDSARDPGRRSRASVVPSGEQLLLINLQRAKEALRVLEEGSRVVAPGRAAAFQDLRFRLYDLERSLLCFLAAVRDRRPRRGRRPRSRVGG